jgi:hypothetical protein
MHKIGNDSANQDLYFEMLVHSLLATPFCLGLSSGKLGACQPEHNNMEERKFGSDHHLF